MLEEFDIISYLEDSNIPYSDEGKNISSNWIGLQCPLCDDTSTHLGVNLDSKSFSCFRCGEKGNAIKLVAILERISQKKAVKIVRKYFDSNFFLNPREEIKHTDSVQLPLGVTKNFTSTHLEYLQNRNFNPQYLINKYNLYAGGVVGEFAHRIVAPVYLDKKLISFVGRDITNLAEKRYKNLSNEKSSVEIKKILYNIDTVKQDVILVEGLFDVFRIGDGCVATLGTVVTNEQILLLKGLRNVFILFDSEEKDKNAKRQAEELASRISLFVKNVETINLTKGDPCDMLEDEVLQLRKEINI